MTRIVRGEPKISSWVSTDRGGFHGISFDHGGACGIACALLVSVFCVHLVLTSAFNASAAEPPRQEKQAKNDLAADRFMTLGTKGGKLGGEEQKTFERSQIKSQIKTFIPPLLRPAFTQHAFILPPKTYSIGLTQRYMSFDGEDVFLDGNVDPRFKDRDVERHFTDLDLLYGFDLNRKYLHGFTVKLNVPIRSTRLEGHLHPVGGNEIPRADAFGSTLDVGDVGLFLKKKVLDQGNGPIGLAVVGAVFFPTGNNDEKFGNNGVINTLKPSGNSLGTFGRFSDDGRLPSRAQPGTGSFSYLAGAFFTRQFSPGGFPGRSAFHFGAAHKFVFEDDGIDPGDTTTYFATFVKPLYKDFLSLDLSLIGIYQQDDSYDGQFIKPGTPNTLIDRPAFSGGNFHFIAPSLIFSPDPQIRMTVSGLYRFTDPDLGPAPPWVVGAKFDVIF